MKTSVKIILVICIVLCITSIFSILKYRNKVEKLSANLEFYTDSLNRYTKLYPSTDFKELKKENKELYNQLRDKEALIEAIEFEYKYKYESKENVVNKPIETDSLYQFKEQTDTIEYNLDIWATHIQKYKIRFNLTNKFLITRQQIENENRIEINSQLPGKIQDVTVWSKPTKKPRFGAGISIGAGYGFFTRKPDIFIGVTGTYLIWRK